MSNVVYDYNQQVNILSGIIMEILNESTNTALDWLTINTNLKHFSGIFKNKSFFEEQEVRVIYYPDKDHDYNESFVSGPYEYKENLERYELNWFHNENNHAIENIIIGCRSGLSAEEVHKMMNEKGVNITKSKILTSESTYR